MLYYNAVSNQITTSVVSNGVVTVAGLSYKVLDETQFTKIAVRYSNVLGISLWVNGVNRASALSPTLPISMSRLGLDSSTGSGVLFSKIKSILLFKNYLSNVDMVNLTT
jgi:hypothetical protein